MMDETYIYNLPPDEAEIWKSKVVVVEFFGGFGDKTASSSIVLVLTNLYGLAWA